MAKIPSPCGLGEELGALFDEVESVKQLAQTTFTRIQNIGSDPAQIATLVLANVSLLQGANEGLVGKVSGLGDSISAMSPPTMLDEIFDKTKKLQSVLEQFGPTSPEGLAAIALFGADIQIIKDKYDEILTEYGIDILLIADYLQTGDITPKMLCDILPNVSILPDGTSVEKALPIEFPETGINDIIGTASEVVTKAKDKLLNIDKILTAPAALRILDVNKITGSSITSKLKNRLPSGIAKDIANKHISNFNSEYENAASFISEITGLSATEVKAKGVSELSSLVKNNEGKLDPQDETEEGVTEGVLVESTSWDPQNGIYFLEVLDQGLVTLRQTFRDNDRGLDNYEPSNYSPYYSLDGWYPLIFSAPRTIGQGRQNATGFVYIETVPPRLGVSLSAEPDSAQGRITHAILWTGGANYSRIPDYRLESGTKKLNIFNGTSTTDPRQGTNEDWPAYPYTIEDKNPQAGPIIGAIDTQPKFGKLFLQTDPANQDDSGPSPMDKFADLIESIGLPRPNVGGGGGGGGDGTTTDGSGDWTQYDDDWTPDTYNAPFDEGENVAGYWMRRPFRWDGYTWYGKHQSLLTGVWQNIGGNPEFQQKLVQVQRFPHLNNGDPVKVIGAGYGGNSMSYYHENFYQTKVKNFQFSGTDFDNFAITGCAAWAPLNPDGSYKLSGNVVPWQIQLTFDVDPTQLFYRYGNGLYVNLEGTYSQASQGTPQPKLYRLSNYGYGYTSGTHGGTVFFRINKEENAAKPNNFDSIHVTSQVKLVGGLSKPVDNLGQGPRIEFPAENKTRSGLTNFASAFEAGDYSGDNSGLAFGLLFGET